MAMNAFELFAKIGADTSGLEEGLGRAGGMLSSFGGTLTAGIGAIAGATTAAVGAAATGVISLTTQAVNAYGEYEQLTGGISKLFGTSGMELEEYAASVGSTVDEVREQYESLTRAEDLMAENAANAYATAGVSANQYMQTVTSFSAALINSLDGNTEEAARIADIAMQDLADNANTFGTMTASELANVYSGLARGNFTLLDNLNLGFAGSQEGMLNLLNASGMFEEELQSLDGITFDQMLLAIHEVQDNMGIAGTTANEAMGTIQGSIGMLQGAWQNLLTGLGDSEADLSGLIDNVVTSALAVVDNITPIAQQAMEGIASLLTQLAPILEEQLPGMIETVLPALITATTSIITALADALPDIANVLLPQIPPIIQRIVPVILSLIPSLLSIGGQIVGAVIQGIVQNAGEIAQAGIDMLQTLLDSFAESANGDGLSQLVNAIFTIIEMFGTFLVENAPMLIQATTDFITQLVAMLSDPTNLGMMIDLALQLILAVADGLVMALPQLVSTVVMLIGNVVIAILDHGPDILNAIGQLLGTLGAAVLEFIFSLGGTSLTEVADNLASIGTELSTSFADFLTGFGSFVDDAVAWISGMWTDIVDFFGGGITDVMDGLAGWWEEISTWFTDLVSNAVTWASDFVTGFVDGIRNGISNIGSAMSDFAGEVASYIHFSEPDIGPLSDASTYAPDFVDLFASGIEDSLPTLGIAMNRMGDYVAGNMPTMEGSMAGGTGITMPPIILQNYIGTEQLDEVMVNSNQRVNHISGGRG